MIKIKKMKSSNVAVKVIIPAAGVGKRMKSPLPKQYLRLGNKTVLEHTLSIFAAHPAVTEIVVAISESDEYWPGLDVSLQKPLHVINGGIERCDTVLNALTFLQRSTAKDDWVMVHDAARPCLRTEDLDLLLQSAQQHESGGLLAIPVRDTMKRALKDTTRVKCTEQREGLWHALTPQMFPFGLLKNALQDALENNILITDESSAMEYAGYQPLLVEGHADNLKITRPEDLALAGFYLQQQGKQ